MNGSGRQMQRANKSINLIRKRKLEDVDTSGKRSRFSNGPQSHQPTFFKDPSVNFASDQNSTHASKETTSKPQPFYKSPPPIHIQKPRTSPYSSTDQSKRQTSPYDPANSRNTLFSANNRLKKLRDSFGTGSESNHSEVHSNSSCTNSSSSRCSNTKPSWTAKPSSIQERLKNLKKSFKPPSSSTSAHPPFGTSAVQDSMNLLFPDGSTSNDTNNSEDEAMDWCAFEEKEVLDNITKLRKKNVISKLTPMSIFQEKISTTLEKMEVNDTMFREIYIVVDTNVFISNLGLIEELLSLEINGVVNPSIMIPWTVIQELDYLKDSIGENDLGRKAKMAIRFINEKLSAQDKQVKGQSVLDAAEQNFASKNADDSILFCCLQIKERKHNAILLSNDINLRNKALINGVLAYSHQKIIEGLDPYRDTGDGLKLRPGFDYSKVKQVEGEFSTLFSYIIDSKTTDAYGSSRAKMYPELTVPPWTLEKCLSLFKKFWRSIFGLFLRKQFMYTINDFIEFRSKNSDLESMSASKIKTFIDTGLSICSYIQEGSVAYKDNAIHCRKKIEDLTKDFFVYTN
ncbi:hypothetical protein PPYR_10334 [Photinus pyralis]|uniref:PIN domain-containing protein n=1 Tax=Photinus pyralis TaxID=7054 RepID=A0A1Y1NB57_PHOPY|nr:transcriptional protein SWT1 isoform X2 [Photinus pyralis]KAB0796273.1 hypothetical protein PPYR_10334 [Photinus pyralis]